MSAPATSELKDTKNTRLEREPAPRRPRVGDGVLYREWCCEAREHVQRAAVVTSVADPENPDSAVTLTVFTPGAPTGTAALQGVRRGGGIEQWEFPA